MIAMDATLAPLLQVKDLSVAFRQGARAHFHVLADGAEVGRQPVGNNDQPTLAFQGERTEFQKVVHGDADIPGAPATDL